MRSGRRGAFAPSGRGDPAHRGLTVEAGRLVAITPAKALVPTDAEGAPRVRNAGPAGAHRKRPRDEALPEPPQRAAPKSLARARETGLIAATGEPRRGSRERLARCTAQAGSASVTGIGGSIAIETRKAVDGQRLILVRTRDKRAGRMTPFRRLAGSPAGFRQEVRPTAQRPIALEGLARLDDSPFPMVPDDQTDRDLRPVVVMVRVA